MKHFIAALALSLAVPASAQVVNIAPGTNIQTVIDANEPGTTYVLQAGVHRMQAFTPQSGDEFKGELSGSTKLTIVDGSRVLDTWVQDGAVWYATGQTQGGDQTGSPLDCLSTYPMCRYPEDLFVNNTLVARSETLVAMTEFQWFFDYAADRIYLGFNPSGQTIETSVTRAMVLPSSADNVIIRDLIVEQYASENGTAALSLGYSPGGAEGWVADNVEARWNHYAGIGNDTNTTVRNSYLHHNGNSGFVGAGGGVLIEDNEIAWNGVAAGFDDLSVPAGFDPYWGSGGSKWVFTNGMIVRDNYSHHNYGPGLWTDIENIACLYQNNVSSDNWRSGIFHEVSYSCTITGNTTERNGGDTQHGNILTNCGIEVLSSPGGVATVDDIEVTLNTVRDNWHGICVWDDVRNTGVAEALGGACPGAGCDLNVRDVWVHHNTIRQASSGTGGLSGFQDAEGDGYDGDNNRFENNTYCLTGTDNPLSMFSWDGDDTLSVAEWQATGNDTTSAFDACGGAAPHRMRIRR
jgi:hypothetical protein